MMKLPSNPRRSQTASVAHHHVRFAAALIVAAILVTTGYLALGGLGQIGDRPAASRPSATALMAAGQSHYPPISITSGAAASSTDSAPWPDGLPRVLDGMPVVRGNGIGAHAASAADAAPFLIGGFMVNVQTLCADEVPANPLVQACANGWLLVDSPSWPPHLSAGGGYYQLVVGSDTTSVPGSWNYVSPQVLRVHVNDPRASACPAAILQQCRQAIVVEAVIWVGPAVVGPAASGSAVHS